MLKKIAMVVVIALLPSLTLAAEKVPYVATLASTHFEMIYPTPGANTERCALLDTFAPLPPEMGLKWGLIKIEAIGHSTLMGLVTDVQSHCTPLPINPELAGPPPADAPPAPFVLGEATLTGANGDTIYGVYEGLATFTATGLVIDGKLTTTGGTGRFLGVTGEGRAFGVQGPSSSAMILTGTMSSPGSAKKGL